MSSKRMLGITVAGVILVAVMIIIGILLLNMPRDTREAPLPDTQSALSPDLTPTGAGTVNNGLERVEVTTDTVQDVIATLTRPESYSRTVKIEKFYGENQKSASFNISTAVYKGVTALRMEEAGTDKTIIVGDDAIYIWYERDSEPYKGPLGSSGDGTRTSDEYQMIVTYEDILSLDQKNILDAYYGDYDGQYCIVVTYQSGLLGYITRCYVSVELGLLVGAEQYDGGKRIFRMTAGPCDLSEPDQSMYALPDGTNIVNGP
jgi:hypothetical protein